MYETLTVNGTDLATVVTCITSLDGIYNVASPRGDNLTIPGVDGEIFTDKPFDLGQVDLGLILSGDTTTEFNDALRVLKALIPPATPLNLTRQMSFTTGDETHTAVGEYISGLSPSLSLMRFGRTTLSLRLLEGLWYSDTTTSFSKGVGTFTATVGGEVRTHRMSISLAGGGSIQNVSTGHTLSLDMSGFTYTGGISPTDTVTIDVEQMTATQDSRDVSSAMTWNQRFPMRLIPGPNVLTGSACTIVYTGAYL